MTGVPIGTAPLLVEMTLAADCSMLDLDGCNEPPDAPAATAFTLLDVGND